MACCVDMVRPFADENKTLYGCKFTEVITTRMQRVMVDHSTSVSLYIISSRALTYNNIDPLPYYDHARNYCYYTCTYMYM